MPLYSAITLINEVVQVLAHPPVSHLVIGDSLTIVNPLFAKHCDKCDFNYLSPTQRKQGSDRLDTKGVHCLE